MSFTEHTKDTLSWRRPCSFSTSGIGRPEVGNDVITASPWTQHYCDLLRVDLLQAQGPRASRLFSVLTRRWWNGLPLAVLTAESLTVFKQRLKTHLFIKPRNQHFIHFFFFFTNLSIYIFFCCCITSNFYVSSFRSLIFLVLDLSALAGGCVFNVNSRALL